MEARLIKRCSQRYVLSANTGSKKTRRNKYASLALDRSDPTGHVRAVWKNKVSVKVCGLEASTEDDKLYFPKRPTKRSRRGGYFTDPEASGSNRNFLSLTVYFKKRQ